MPIFTTAQGIEIREHRGMKTILYVDGDETVRDLIGEILISLGYSWIEADGVQKALAMIDRVNPDLLLIDLEMPDVGMLVEEIKNNPRFRDLPIVGITATSGDELPVVADELLFKPFCVSSLRETLQLRMAGSLVAKN